MLMVSRQGGRRSFHHHGVEYDTSNDIIDVGIVRGAFVTDVALHTYLTTFLCTKS